MFHLIRTWLGLHKHPPAVGVHLTAERLTIAAVRPNPTRLVAIGRYPVSADTATGDLRLLAGHLGLAPGIPAVVAVEPATPRLSLLEGRRHEEPVCHIRRQAYYQIATIVTAAGLKLVRIDVVPAAIARLGRLAELGPGDTIVRTEGQWAIRTGPAVTEAIWEADPSTPHPAPGRFGLGRDAGSIQWFDAWPGLRVPRSLRPVIDASRDAVAVGAALAGLGFPPLITAHPLLEPDPHTLRRTVR